MVGEEAGEEAGEGVADGLLEDGVTVLERGEKALLVTGILLKICGEGEEAVCNCRLLISCTLSEASDG